LIDPLQNDSDPNDDTITIFNFTQPLHGFVFVNEISDGDMNYFPNTNFAGVDYFRYAITDGFGGFDSANVTITIPGDLYVASELDSQIVRYDGSSGNFIDNFVSTSSGGLDEPIDLTFGFDGNLYVSSSFTDEILVYDGATGVFLEDFVTEGSGGLEDPRGLAFGGFEDLYVSSSGTGEVLRYAGIFGGFDSITFDFIPPGEFIEVFVAAGSGGLGIPSDLILGPDGDLYVLDERNGDVLRYDGFDGTFIEVFVSSDASGPFAPTSFTFGPKGDLYIGSSVSTTDEVLRYDGITGEFKKIFVSSGLGGLDGATGLVFGPDKNLYVSSNNTNSIIKYDGTTGALISSFVITGLNVPQGLIFGPKEVTIASLAPPTGVTITSTGTLPGGTFSFAEDINESDQVVGLSDVDVGDGVFEEHGFVWDDENGMTDLLTLPKHNFSVAVAINDDGLIVGQSGNLTESLFLSHSNPFLWDDNAEPKMQNLSSLGGSQGAALAINNVGQVVGWSLTSDQTFEQQAFIWDDVNGIQDIGSLGGDSIAIDINEAGQVVGCSWIDTDFTELHPFIWNSTHGMQDLGTFGGIFSCAYEINEQDQVIGDSETGAGFPNSTSRGLPDIHPLNDIAIGTTAINQPSIMTDSSSATELHAFIWDLNNGMQDIGSFGGSFTTPFSINDAGQVVGFSETDSLEFHAFIWDDANGMTDIGTISGGFDSFAIDINELGHVIGYSTTSVFFPKAFVWDSTNGLQDIGTLGGSASFAHEINDNDIVVGDSHDSSVDELGAVWDVSSIVTINALPVVTITAPTDSSTHTQGASVTFTGTATDTEDGTISTDISWSSSLDSGIGSGASFSTSTLSLGTHTITAAVTDADGASDSDSISITIVSNASPAVTITVPSGPVTINEGDSQTFTATAIDAEDGNVAASLQWSSDLDDGIGSGASFSTTSLSVGVHTITATATDSLSLSGSDTETVTINALPVVTITAPTT